jgi:5-methylcytosine-specific restriction endonuclease McrBC GTP-binding regulatory subunit McrB
MKRLSFLQGATESNACHLYQGNFPWYKCYLQNYAYNNLSKHEGKSKQNYAYNKAEAEGKWEILSTCAPFSRLPIYHHSSCNK